MCLYYFSKAPFELSCLSLGMLDLQAIKESLASCGSGHWKGQCHAQSQNSHCPGGAKCLAPASCELQWCLPWSCSACAATSWCSWLRLINFNYFIGIFCWPCLYHLKGRKGRLLQGLRGEVLLGQNLDQMEGVLRLNLYLSHALYCFLNQTMQKATFITTCSMFWDTCLGTTLYWTWWGFLAHNLTCFTLDVIHVTCYSEQQNHSHVWKFWIVHLIEGKIKFLKLYKYSTTCPIILPIWQIKNFANQLVASQDTIILWPRSHLNGFVAN